MGDVRVVLVGWVGLGRCLLHSSHKPAHLAIWPRNNCSMQHAPSGGQPATMPSVGTYLRGLGASHQRLQRLAGLLLTEVVPLN